MIHSYLKSNHKLPQCLKGKNGEMTSEAFHMKSLEHLSHKINFRHGTGVLAHNKQERMLRAEIKKAVKLGHGKPFYNEKIRISEDSGNFTPLTMSESKSKGLIISKKAA